MVLKIYSLDHILSVDLEDQGYTALLHPHKGKSGFCGLNDTSALTRNTDMTATSIELLAEAGAILLLGCSINVNVIWIILQVLG